MLHYQCGWSELNHLPEQNFQSHLMYLQTTCKLKYLNEHTVQIQSGRGSHKNDSSFVLKQSSAIYSKELKTLLNYWNIAMGIYLGSTYAKELIVAFKLWSVKPL